MWNQAALSVVSTHCCLPWYAATGPAMTMPYLHECCDRGLRLRDATWLGLRPTDPLWSRMYAVQSCCLCPRPKPLHNMAECRFLTSANVRAHFDDHMPLNAFICYLYRDGSVPGGRAGWRGYVRMQVVCTGKEDRLIDCKFPQNFGSPVDDYGLPVVSDTPAPTPSPGLTRGSCNSGDRQRFSVICRRFEITGAVF